MSNQIKAMMKALKQETARTKQIKIRNHLNADAFLPTMGSGFKKIKDNRLGKVPPPSCRCSCGSSQF